jgi:hypothetical protein
MPGAPNRPPETGVPAPPPAVDDPAKHVLRRLAPSRVALRLDVWRNAPSPELLKPFNAAESAYAAGDFPGAENALDQLAVRFAEPRWPTMPEPFRRLRVQIPAPMPPAWDPEFSLPGDEKERRKAHRSVEGQVALAEGVVRWASEHGVDLEDPAATVAEARRRFTDSAPDAEVQALVDGLWAVVRARVPAPGGAPAARPAPPAESAEAG